MSMDKNYIKVAAASIESEVGCPMYNADRMIEKIRTAYEQDAKLVVFPELSITGYTCSDLFLSKNFLDEAQSALDNLVEKTAHIDILIVVGMPVSCGGRLYNTAVFLNRGKLLACIPKTYIPDYGEYFESRYFTSAAECAHDTVALCNQRVPMGTDILLMCNNWPAFSVGCEICEDLWVPVSPSVTAALHGAGILCNLSASNDFSGKNIRREVLVAAQSAKLKCAYIYSTCGNSESSTDLSFGNNKMIGFLGTITASEADEDILYSTIDLESIDSTRRRANTFLIKDTLPPIRVVAFEIEENHPALPCYDPHPFYPQDRNLDEVCQQVFDIQIAGLSKRVKSIGVKKIVVGISGGLDSTLAFLVATETMRRLQGQPADVIAVTMPSFGTTSGSYQNSVSLIKRLNATFMEINISEAVNWQLKTIGHDFTPDTTFENAQARERTQLLMNISNNERGIMIGTSDLSEIAIGFSTYSGDHMSMYNVNASVPKTLVREIIKWYAKKSGDAVLEQTLFNVTKANISPELMPVDKDGVGTQLTESIVGNYELIDFILYYHIKYGFSKEKIVGLAKAAFDGAYSAEDIEYTCGQYFKRFYANQFKRSCMPDGVKATELSLSPRSDFRLPSDLNVKLIMDLI